MKNFVAIALVGIGATAFLDLWALARKALFGIALTNYALVGRWIGHFRRGRLRHASISSAAGIRGELFIGWMAHYLIGIAFAALLAVFPGTQWFREPTLLPAVIVGVLTVTVPFLLMQPAMGAGIAASRTPDPRAARFQSLATHTIFGLGLYFAAAALAA